MLPEHTREGFSCGHMLSIEIARLYGNSTLTFKELPIHFTKWLHHFPFSPAMHEAPIPPQLPPNFCSLSFSLEPSGCEMASYCDFNFISLMINDADYLLHLLATYIFFGDVYLDLLLTLKLDYLSFFYC